MDQIALKGGQNGADTMNSLVVTKKNFCYAMMNRLRIDLDKPVVTYTRLSTMQRLRRLWRENPALQFVAIGIAMVTGIIIGVFAREILS